MSAAPAPNAPETATTTPWRAATSWLRSIKPRRENLKSDALAGLTTAVSSIPDGMACGLLAGVSPVHGLYASFSGQIGGGLTSSTRLMVVTTTSAAALATGSAIAGVPADQRSSAVLWLTLIAGALMIVAALLKLGRYVRFVSQSVMLGFLTGVAANIVLGQLDDITGAPTRGSLALTKALSVVAHPGAWSWASIATGVGALAILLGLKRTRLAGVGALVALLVPTVIVILTGAHVARVHDTGEIPSGFPTLGIPALSALTSDVFVGAITVTLVVLVQGAGVAEASSNPDGSRSRTNGDFTAQGVANLAAGLFGGQPVGGSVSATALNVASGSRSRWSAIFSGCWILVFLVALSTVVGQVAMPTLGAILVYAAVGSLRPRQLRTMMYAGRTASIALVATFVATLLLPVAAAVAIGIVISLLLQLNQESVDLRVVRLVPQSPGMPREQPAPKVLHDHEVVILDVYGSLFYAGARTLKLLVPDASSAQDAAIVLRLRGRTTLGATFFLFAAEYADALEANGGRLYLSGLSPAMLQRWESRVLAEHLANVRLYAATDLVGESTHQAWLDASSRRVGATAPRAGEDVEPGDAEP